jgi:hypothetical protein
MSAAEVHKKSVYIMQILQINQSADTEVLIPTTVNIQNLDSVTTPNSYDLLQ